MKQQTAVEWLVEQLKDYDFTPPSNNEEYVIVMPKWIFNAKRERALEMEKQQIIDFTDSYILKCLSCNYDGDPISLKETEQYYKETYKPE